ncbi:hypothetical protein L195_g008520 [Trifolium pratense]|uniref:Uncharacterized protein n=1 Tax=Trifolium pratense TaxID=57577 RepID=A0A2K3P9E3_TRIPR|nr:hypothetical protein L195_g008520 [Trifolium pratense]
MVHCHKFHIGEFSSNKAVTPQTPPLPFELEKPKFTATSFCHRKYNSMQVSA